MKPLPSIRLLAGLCTTVTPCSASRRRSTGVVQMPCATDRCSFSSPLSAISRSISAAPSRIAVWMPSSSRERP
ncbi:MAG: hypothetical protein L6R19_16725 [Alphaproteobacteria bacterium]|nr:hypothetical protein [Alphaproteobacteria bacterium]